jgi:hypothetical protein
LRIGRSEKLLDRAHLAGGADPGDA